MIARTGACQQDFELIDFWYLSKLNEEGLHDIRLKWEVRVIKYKVANLFANILYAKHK